MASLPPPSLLAHPLPPFPLRSGLHGPYWIRLHRICNDYRCGQLHFRYLQRRILGRAHHSALHECWRHMGIHWSLRW